MAATKTTSRTPVRRTRAPALLRVTEFPQVPGESNGSRQRDGSDTLFRSLLATMGLLRRAMEPFFARHGVSGSQWGVLRVLYRAELEGESRLRLTDIGDRLLIRPPSVTGVVNRLRAMGLVTSGIAPNDQRAKQVALTVAGRELVETVRRHHAQHVARILTVLSVSERKQLHDVLARLGTHLQAMIEPGVTGVGDTGE